MSKQQRGLGKGLSALLGSEPGLGTIRQPVGYVNKEVVSNQAPKQPTADILRIPVDMIEPNPYQPRMSFDQEALDELADSIRTLGLIQPITVRQIAEGRYQIISGERRFRACRLAGMDMIPAYIRDANDQGMLEMAIVENIQRENLDPIEVAMSYQRLIDECNLTQEQMAFRVGKKRASVTNFLRLLKLPAKIQHDLKVGLLSVGGEDSKGSELTKETFKRMSELPINFAGNVEADTVFEGAANVLISDGFAGNVLLKGAEGLAKSTIHWLKLVLSKNAIRLIGASLAKNAFHELKAFGSADEIGGAPLLGVNGIVIIGHGSSNPKAVLNAIRVAGDCVKFGLNDMIVEKIKAAGIEFGAENAG